MSDNTDSSGQKPQNTDSAEQILEMVVLHFGENEGQKFVNLIRSGITPEVYKAFKAGQDSSPTGSGSCEADGSRAEFRQHLLDGLKNGDQVEHPTAWLERVKEVQAEGYSRVDAVLIASKRYPGEYRAYIQSANPEVKVNWETRQHAEI